MHNTVLWSTYGIIYYRVFGLSGNWALVFDTDTNNILGTSFLETRIHLKTDKNKHVCFEANPSVLLQGF